MYTPDTIVFVVCDYCGNIDMCNKEINTSNVKCTLCNGIGNYTHYNGIRNNVRIWIALHNHNYGTSVYRFTQADEPSVDDVIDRIRADGSEYEPHREETIEILELPDDQNRSIIVEHCGRALD